MDKKAPYQDAYAPRAGELRRVIVRVSKDIYDGMARAAQQRDIPVSELARRAVDAEIARFRGWKPMVVVRRHETTHRMVVTLAAQQVDFLKAWPECNLSDHLRRAFDAFYKSEINAVFDQDEVGKILRFMREKSEFLSYPQWWEPIPGDGWQEWAAANLPPPAPAPKAQPAPAQPQQRPAPAQPVSRAALAYPPVGKPSFGPPPVVPAYEAPEPGDPRPPKPAIPHNIPPPVRFDK